MFTILSEIWSHITSLKPGFISKTPHFNFITVHYFWIIGMALLGSICIYPNGGLAYIDALFLSSGAATQSGLNTVNINALNTWQQIVFYIVSMSTNPIVINSSVVFLRLYWFEKRFRHIALEAKKNRRSISKTLSKAKTVDRDIGKEERGVNGRNIVVMHNTTKTNHLTNDGTIREDSPLEGKSTTNEEIASSGDETEYDKGLSSESGEDSPQNGTQETPHEPQIKFADQVKRSDGMADDPLRVPTRQGGNDHITFVERQRNPDDKAVLRIPGPRDADAGVAPQAVDESDTIHPVISAYNNRRGSRDTTALNGDDHLEGQEEAPRRNITIEVPNRSATDRTADDSRPSPVSRAFGALRSRNTKAMDDDKAGAESSQMTARFKMRSHTFQSIKSALSKDQEEPMPYLSWEPTVGRNSIFVGLSEAQREELGGIEYRSLKSLATILIVYFVGFSVFGVVCLTPWIYKSATYGKVVTDAGQGRAWWGIFTANSAFNDLGYTLTPDSMISFGSAIWPLLVMTFLIIIGNTGFPIMLRIIIWVTVNYVPKGSGIWEELKFLLDHPRRCFTLLFPAQATWWLFWILVALNVVDLVFFIILDLGNTVVTQLPVNIRVLDGWFQAVSTRTAGFGVVNLAELHPAIQVSYLVMMYISVLPIAISVRRTNVYEEKSLGIYGSTSEDDKDESEPSYVGAHLRRQLSFDLWYIFLGLFIVSISEGSRLQNGDPAFTMFAVLFEIVSAYGTVGLSLGYTGIDASFSAEFGVIGKLVIIAMQIRGRHRGLPYELDRAILLPSEHLQRKEEEDDAEQLRRRNSQAFSTTTTGKVEKSKSIRSEQTQNFLSTAFHPGPTIPNSHRNSHRVDLNYERRRSLSTNGKERSGPSFRTESLPLGKESVSQAKSEGRRSFFKEGLHEA
ncbi:hypothetical protein B7494_g4412 [Chlorociboria aeruginascens]|nr:hypothetical protein B7494_g4412 [Chlorociboria aeruginascens]